MIKNLATDASYEVYKTFMAMKRHFDSDKYDYFEYNGKVRVMSWSEFQTKGDVYFYAKLARHEDWKGRLIASMAQNPKVWINDILDQEDIYKEWKKRVDSLTYTFTSDLSMIEEDYFNNFKSVGGQHPPLITLCLRKKITLETFAILCKISKVFDVWKEELADKFVAIPLAKRAAKYERFLEYDEKKFKSIVREQFF